MASGSAKTSYHSTTAAALVDTVTLTKDYRFVRVINRGSADLFLQVNDRTANILLANQAESLVVAAGKDEVLAASSPGPTAGSTIVQVVSTGVNAYSVIGHSS
jgi:hypothetical protein